MSSKSDRKITNRQTSIYFTQVREQRISQMKEILKWMKDNNIQKFPRWNNVTNSEERRLGSAFSYLKVAVIDAYLGFDNNEDREIYREKYPEIDELVEILYQIEEIEYTSVLSDLLEIKQWLEKNNRVQLPIFRSKDEEEKNLAIIYRAIKIRLKRTYSTYKTEENIENYKKQQPKLKEVIDIVDEIESRYLDSENKDESRKRGGNNSTNNSRTLKKDKNQVIVKNKALQKAKKVLQWMKDNNRTQPPSIVSEDLEEIKMAKLLKSVIDLLIRPYLSYETEEDRNKFREKHPEIDEVQEVVNEIQKNKQTKNRTGFIVNARKIQAWMEANTTDKPPSVSSKDEEERKLGRALNYIKNRLIKPYVECETDEEKLEFFKKYPELEEVLQILKKIDANNPIRVRKSIDIANVSIPIDIEQVDSSNKLLKDLILDKQYEQTQGKN